MFKCGLLCCLFEKWQNVVKLKFSEFFTAWLSSNLLDTMSSITEEQRKRMEENKQKALKRLQERRSRPSTSYNLNVPTSLTSATASPLRSSVSPISVDKPVQSHPTSNKPLQSSAKLFQIQITKNNQTHNIPLKVASFTHSSFKGKNHAEQTKSSGSPPTLSPSGFYGKTTSVKFSLISKEWFEADFPFMKEIVDVFKTVAGCRYDSYAKKWSFPIGQHNAVVNALKPLKPHVIVGELPNMVFSLLNVNTINVPEETIMTRIEPALATILMDFQKEGVRYAISREGRVLIADDMGLGKTIQALAIASYYKRNWPLLIVCPSSMRFQWKEEIGIHMPSVPPHHVYVMTNSKDYMDITTQVLITSYDLMVSQSSDILKKRFGVVILDESHHLKNPKTARTKVATEIVTYSKNCVLLSGTPVLSRPQELFCQLRAIRPNLFKNFMEFGIRYCDGKQERFGWNFSGSSNMKELSVLLQQSLMIRRLKTEVLGQLPPKRREVVAIEIAEKNKIGDMSILEEKLKEEGLKGIERKSCLLEYFSQTAKAKKDAVCQFVLDMMENGEKFLVFAHHSTVLDAVCKALTSKKIQFIRIDGTTTSENRKLQCVKFQNDEDYLVAVLSIRAASTGLTLTAARLVVFAELFWNPGDLMQAEDRVHRIGQQDCVLIKYLIAHGTADDHIWPMIKTKLDLLNKVGLSKDTFQDTEVIKKTVQQPKENILNYFGSQQPTKELEGVDWAEFDDPFEN